MNRAELISLVTAREGKRESISRAQVGEVLRIVADMYGEQRLDCLAFLSALLDTSAFDVGSTVAKKFIDQVRIWDAYGFAYVPKPKRSRKRKATAHA